MSLQWLRHWGWFKKTLFVIALLTFLTSSFMYLTPPGGLIRQKLAETVISTQHRSWAWIFVGAEQRDLLVQEMHDAIERASREKQDLGLIKINNSNRSSRTVDELIKVEDISGQFWKGKKMYVYDPTSIRVMTPSKPGEGERITSMVGRTGAAAGVNGGSFDDPEGLGNGFAAIGMVISGGEIIFTDQDGSIPQHIVGFTKEGTLVVGKYDAFELRDLGISEAVSFYPRLIANGKPLITSGDGGWGRAPRTAVGQKADGTVIFVVIDGRQSHSVGATLKEVQDLLLAEGVVNAGNLDGGASSELVVNRGTGSELITKPSSRYGERRLPSAFLIHDDPSSLVALNVWDGLDKIDAGGAYDHPDFLREQAEKRAKGQTTAPSSSSSGSISPAPAKTNTDKTKTPADAVKETPSKPATSGTGSGSTVTKPTGGTTGTTNSGSAGSKPGSSTSTGSGSTTVKEPADGKPAGSGTGGNTAGSETGGTAPTAPAGTPSSGGAGENKDGSGTTPAAPSGGTGTTTPGESSVTPPAGNTGSGTGSTPSKTPAEPAQQTPAPVPAAPTPAPTTPTPTTSTSTTGGTTGTGTAVPKQ